MSVSKIMWKLLNGSTSKCSDAGHTDPKMTQYYNLREIGSWTTERETANIHIGELCESTLPYFTVTFLLYAQYPNNLGLLNACQISPSLIVVLLHYPGIHFTSSCFAPFLFF